MDKLEVYSKNVLIQIFKDHWTSFKGYYAKLSGISITDYVEEAIHGKPMLVDRDGDPICPCGSGKKYKKYC